MDNTVQSRKDLYISDIEFSTQLQSLSQIKEPCRVKEFDTIISMHGPFIEDEHANVFFDLRLQDKKPFWGHTHPLTLKLKSPQLKKNPNSIHLNLNQFINESFNVNSNYYIDQLFGLDGDIIPKALRESPQIFLNLWENQYIEFNYGKPKINCEQSKVLYNYIETVVLKGGLLKKRINDIKEYCLKNNKVSSFGLNIMIETSNFDHFKNLCSQNCLYIDEDNLIHDKVFLNFPLSFTRHQIIDCLERVNKVVKESQCL